MYVHVYMYIKEYTGIPNYILLNSYSICPGIPRKSNQAPRNSRYIEPEIPIKNITHTPLTDQVPQFQKETYITKVALYDEKKNLIGVAKVAVPVRKTESRQYTFKLKLDI